MSNIIPFGKYKGQEIEQVRQRDPQYVQWLLAQAWFTEKFGPLAQVVVNVFAPPSEDTPAHNALQVRFLEDEFRDVFWDLADLVDDLAVKLLRHQYDRFNRKVAELNPPIFHEIGRPRFEGVSDVLFCVAVTLGSEEASQALREYRLAIEIKPSMGDDYPAVLRQIKRQKEAARITAFSTSEPAPSHWFLLVDEFGSKTVTLDQVRQIFANDDIKLMLVSKVCERLLERQAR